MGRLDEYRENLKNKKFKRNLFKTLQILTNQMQSLLPNMRLVRRISFLSRPVSGTLLSRPIQLGLLSRCHLSSSVILQKEPPKGFSNFGNKTPDKKGGRKRRESRKQTQKETENDDSVEDEAEKSKAVKKEVKF